MSRSSSSGSLAAIAAMVLAGLASPAGPTSAASPDDACALLTRQDAAVALGENVGQPESKSGLPMGPGMTASNCGYAGSGYHEITLNVIRMTPATAAIYRTMCEKKGHEGLTGLGEMSCWYDSDHEELQVLNGTIFFSIELRGTRNPTEPIKAAAKSVSARLK